MAQIICNSCNLEIKLFAKIFSKQCQTCGALIHSNCVFSGLDYDAFCQKEIKHLGTMCKKCSEKNDQKFGEQRHCECGIDIVHTNELVKCMECGAIGHKECFNKNLREALFKFAKVYSEFDQEATGSFYCPSCKDERKKEEEMIVSRYQDWIDGTDKAEIKGYRVIDTIKILRATMNMPSPLSIEAYLKYNTIRIGGNAFIKFHWDKHESRIQETYLAGYSINGNPYYKSRWVQSIWYTGDALAVRVKPIEK